MIAQAAEPRDEAVVSDAQQRAAGDVADPRGFDHDRARSAPREAAIPVDDRVGDFTGCRATPGSGLLSGMYDEPGYGYACTLTGAAASWSPVLMAILLTVRRKRRARA